MAKKSTGKNGISLIKQFESCKLYAYKATSREQYWTIGWGHYGPDVKPGQTITQDQADSMFTTDLKKYENYVNNTYYCPVTDKLNQNQFDALVSFCYNCGQGNLRELCVGSSIEKIGNDLLLYTRSGGEVLSGLVRRRNAEQALYKSNKSNSVTTINSTDSATTFSNFLKEAERHVGEGASWTWKTYGTSNIPWCAAYVTAVAKTVGGMIGKVLANTAWAQGHAREGVAKGYGKFYKGPSQGGKHIPSRGDLIFFRWSSKSRSDKYDCDHVGIVLSVSSTHVSTVEGNTGTWDMHTSKVMKRSYSLSYNCISGYFRPDWDKVGGASGGDGSGGDAYSDIYDTWSTREDATVREVGYISNGYEPSIKSSDIKLSVINYTSMLHVLVKIALPTSGAGTGNSADTSKLTGNCKVVVDTLISKGLNAAASCGVAGNISHESNFNPGSVGDKGTSFGICQWHSDRGKAMKTYVGDDWATNLSGQLDYLWYDLSHNYKSVLSSLKGVSNDVSGCKQAADVFVRKFEVPANVDTQSEKRQSTAESYFKKLVITDNKNNENSSSNCLTQSGKPADIVKTVDIPSSVKQSGLTKNYTNYTFMFPSWTYTCRKIADIWDKKGRKSSRNIATIDGYYLLAASSKFGKIGDILTVKLQDGQTFNAIMADVKGGDAQSPWGHKLGSGIDIIEWESIASGNKGDKQINLGSWAGVKVKTIYNRGTYLR